MQWFPDILSTFKDLGILAATAFILIYIVGWWILKQLGKYIDMLDQICERVEKIYRSNLDPTRPEELIARKTIIDSVEDKGDDLARDLQEIIKRQCGSNACPIVPIVKGDIADIKKCIDRFAEEGKANRQETKDEILRISNDIRTFINDFGKESIRVLRLYGRNKRVDDDDI